MTGIALLAVALLLVFASAVFVAAEFSLTTVDHTRLRHASARGETGARSALRAVEDLIFQLSGAQLGITVTSLLLGMIAESSTSALLSSPLESAGVSPSWVPGIALVLGTGLAAAVMMVLGELVPKNWAISSPLKVARLVAGPQQLFSRTFRPFIRHLNATANRVLVRLGMRPAQSLASARSAQELGALARHSAERGALATDTAELFVRTLGLAELTAHHVMTPRVQVVALDIRAYAEDVADATRATGLSRYPVYRGNLDSVAGVVHVKDVLAVPADRRAAEPVTTLLREPLRVPATYPADQLLDQLSRHRGLAVVVDEYEGTAGVVSLEDIIEEVVGEVRDEHDPQQTVDIRLIGADQEGRALYGAEGSVRVDQLRTIGFHAPPGPYETLAGLIAVGLGRIPSPGDHVDSDGWRIDVISTEQRHVTRAHLHAPRKGTV